MYFALSLIANLAGAVFSGVKFAQVLASINDSKGKDRNVTLAFSYGLLAFAIPFYSPISDNLGATVSLFIALSSLSTFIASRSIK